MVIGEEQVRGTLQGKSRHYCSFDSINGYGA